MRAAAFAGEVLAPEVAAREFEGGVWPVVCERAAVDEEMDDGKGEMAPGRQDTGGLADGRRHVGDVHQHIVGDHAIELVVIERQVGGVGDLIGVS